MRVYIHSPDIHIIEYVLFSFLYDTVYVKYWFF